MADLGRTACGVREQRAERRARVFKLRTGGLSIRDIAPVVGTSRSTVAADIRDELKLLARETHESADQLRAIQHARLERLVAEAFSVIARAKDNDDMRLRGIESIRRTCETIARLFGLNVEQPPTVNLDARSVTFVISQAAPTNGTDHSQPDGHAETVAVPQLQSA